MKRTLLTVYLVSPWTIQNGYAEAPVIIMVEGVHNGSHGPIFWSAHILRANAHRWHNVPIAINHPMIDGKYVSINDRPGEIIGHVVNPHFDEAKKALKATIRIPSNHPEIGRIQNIKEVSAGVFNDQTQSYGEWRGEGYYASAISMEPDHLALLPDCKGACSWEDGAGIRANREMQEYEKQVWREAIREIIKQNGGSIMDDQVRPLGNLDTLQAEREQEKINLNQLQKEADDKGMLLPPEVMPLGYPGIEE